MEWKPIETAPKDGSRIIFAMNEDSIGFCYWSLAHYADEEDLWWDCDADQECCPRWWLPFDALPTIPSKAKGE